MDLLLFFAFNCSVYAEVWEPDESFCFFSLQLNKQKINI